MILVPSRERDQDSDWRVRRWPMNRVLSSIIDHGQRSVSINNVTRPQASPASYSMSNVQRVPPHPGASITPVRQPHQKNEWKLKHSQELHLPQSSRV